MGGGLAAFPGSIAHCAGRLRVPRAKAAAIEEQIAMEILTGLDVASRWLKGLDELLQAAGARLSRSSERSRNPPS